MENFKLEDIQSYHRCNTCKSEQNLKNVIIVFNEHQGNSVCLCDSCRAELANVLMEK